jgi:hypothetical protein
VADLSPRGEDRIAAIAVAESGRLLLKGALNGKHEQ